MKMDTIVAVDADWGIGRDNAMLFSIPEDMKFFRQTTLGGVLVMGRLNLESFPGGKPLPKRRNIVLSTSLEPGEGYEVCRTMEEVFNLLAEIQDQQAMVNQQPIQEPRIFSIGGSMVYEEFLPYCTDAYVTKMYRDFKGEKFFPNLDEHPDWHLAAEGDMKEYEGLKFQFLRYENQNVKEFGK